MFRTDFKDTPVWCFTNKELSEILGKTLYNELIESRDIDIPNMYMFSGISKIHISYYFTDKAKQLIKEKFLVD